MKTLFLLGDSTCAKKLKDRKPEVGWGEVFGKYLRDGWVIDNMALNGRSTKSFIDEGVFAQALEKAQEGDAALLQFGHNDSKVQDPSRYAAPFGSYADYLCYMAKALIEKGVSVYFLTSIPRRNFDEAGYLRDTHGNYPAGMKYAADRIKVPCVDVTIPLMIELQMIGPEISKDLFLHLKAGEHPNYPEEKIDNTHLREPGAIWVASVIARELSKLEKKPEFLL